MTLKLKMNKMGTVQAMYCSGQEHSLWSKSTWAGTATPQLTRRVILDKSL